MLAAANIMYVVATYLVETEKHGYSTVSTSFKTLNLSFSGRNKELCVLQVVWNILTCHLQRKETLRHAII